MVSGVWSQDPDQVDIVSSLIQPRVLTGIEDRTLLSELQSLLRTDPEYSGIQAIPKFLMISHLYK